MAAVENIEWLNQNLLRAYPLREDADFTPLLPNGAKAAGLRLPTCLVADFSFTLAFDDADGTVPTLTGVTHAADGFSLEISLGGAVLATKTAKISTHEVNQVYPLVGQGDNADCGGWLVLGDLERAAEELPEGVYRFAAGQLPFEVSTLRMAPRGVRGITAVGKYGLKTYAPLYGNVRIIAGQDMTVRNDADNNAIWLQAESKTGYERTEPCDCGAESTRRVKTVNGMPVEEVEIIGASNCVSVTDDLEKRLVKIADTCSTPCCGCAELNFVESAIATINKSLATLNGYAESLRSRIAELKFNETTTVEAVAAYPGANTTYLVVLNKQSGTGGLDSVTVTYGVPMPPAAMPTRTGYTFGGYYSVVNGGGTQYYRADGTSARTWDALGTATLYAKWTANVYAITFDKQGGGGGTDSVQATYDAAMPAITPPTRRGYTFVGYFNQPYPNNTTKFYNADGTSANSWTWPGDAPLFAVWAPAST